MDKDDALFEAVELLVEAFAVAGHEDIATALEDVAQMFVVKRWPRPEDIMFRTRRPRPRPALPAPVDTRQRLTAPGRAGPDRAVPPAILAERARFMADLSAPVVVSAEVFPLSAVTPRTGAA